MMLTCNFLATGSFPAFVILVDTISLAIDEASLIAFLFHVTASATTTMFHVAITQTLFQDKPIVSLVSRCLLLAYSCDVTKHPVCWQK